MTKTALLVVLLTAGTYSSVQAFVPPRRLFSLHGSLTSLAAAESLEEASTSIKSGIKFLLVPNARTNDALRAQKPKAAPVGTQEAVPTDVGSVPEISSSDALASAPVVPEPVIVPERIVVPEPLVVPEKVVAPDPVIVPDVSFDSGSVVDSVKNLFSTPPPDVSSALAEKFSFDPDSPLLQFFREKKYTQFQFRTPPTLEKFSGTPTFPVEEFQQAMQDAGIIINSDGWTVKELVAALNFGALGAWYFGALGTLLLFASFGSSLDAMAANDAEKKAAISVSADERAALDREHAEEEQYLESQVRILAEATKAVSKQLKELQGEKAKRDYELATMKSDIRTMRVAVEASKSSEAQLRNQLETTTKQLQDATKQAESVTKKSASDAALIESLQREKDKLQAKLDELAMEAALLKAQMEEAAKTKTRTKGTATKAAASKTTEPKAIEKSPATTKTSKKEDAPKITATKASPVPKASPAPETAPTPKKAAPKKTPATKASEKPLSASKSAPAPKPAAAPKKAEKAVPATKTISKTAAAPTPKLEGAFFASVEEAVIPETTLSKKATPKKSATKAKTSSNAQTTEEPPGDDWSKLSASALSRKTVKELTSYLEAKGAIVTDAAGKPLKKAELVEAILSS